MATLNDHLAELRRLLHDPNDQYWDQPMKLANLNAGIKQRDLMTGGNRLLIPYTLTTGQGTYSFADLGNTSVFDVVSIVVLYNGLRIVLNQVPYTVLTTRPEYRAWTTFRDVPQAFARYGANGVRLGPLPSLGYSSEWDCCVFSGDLIATDTDPLPFPYTQPVPFYAAYLCKYNERRPDEAQVFLDEFHTKCSLIEGARTGLLPNAYASGRR